MIDKITSKCSSGFPVPQLKETIIGYFLFYAFKILICHFIRTWQSLRKKQKSLHKNNPKKKMSTAFPKPNAFRNCYHAACSPYIRKIVYRLLLLYNACNYEYQANY